MGTLKVKVNGEWVAVGGSAPGPPTGSMSAFAAAVAPPGWLICDGAAVSRTTFPELFAVIGVTWGAGDGSTTFTLPNLKGRVPVGMDDTVTEFNTFAKIGGSVAVVLSVNDLPAHNHYNPDHNHVMKTRDYDFGSNPGAGGAWTALGANATFERTSDLAYNSGASWSGNTGADWGHANVQPYATMHWIIKI